LSDKQKNQEEFKRLLKEVLASTDPDRIIEIGHEMRQLNQEYFSPVSESVEVKVPASS